MKILIFGGGKMGSAFATGLNRAKTNSTEIVVVDPMPTLQSNLKNEGIRVTRSVDALFGESWIPRHVICALKPDIAVNVLEANAKYISKAETLISLAAGISLPTLMSIRPGPFYCIRAMPNMPVMTGQGVIGAVCPISLPTLLRNEIELLLTPLGKLFWLADDQAIDSLTAISGSGPAYAFHFVEALGQAAQKLDMPAEQANEIARQTLIGAVRMLMQSARSPTDHRNDVTSPNGTTAAALAVLMAESGLETLLTRATRAAFERAREIASE
ncbi:MAG: pyrroline-5-carboxylate reductase, partial [Pseudomonadales bacterium]